MIGDPGAEVDGTIRVFVEIPVYFIKTVDVPLTWSNAEAGHGSDTTQDVEPAKNYCLL
jgi:hypothetical protein